MILIDDNDDILDYINECSPSFGKHAIIDVAINFFVPAPVTDSFSYRDYNNIYPTALNELLNCCDRVRLDMDSIETDLEGALNNLNANLSHAINELAPLKIVKPNKNMFHGLVLS